MKLLATVTIDAPSRNDLKDVQEIMGKSIEDARLYINNGAKVKLGWTNADDPSEMASLMGQLKWWTLGATQVVKHPKKTWLGMVKKELKSWKIGEELRSLLEDEPEI